MKLPFIVLSFLLFSCGAVDEEFEIAEDASVIFDAENVDGSSGLPSSDCDPDTWADLSGNGKTGNIRNVDCDTAFGWVGTGTSVDPYALALNGVDQAVTTALAASPTAMPESTWMAWVYPTRVSHSSDQQILSIDTFSSKYHRSLAIESGSSNFTIYLGTGTPHIWSPTTVTLNTWQFVAVVFRSNDVEFYKNNESFSFGSAPSYDSSSPDTLTVGASTDGTRDEFQGRLAWLAVYDRALDSLEIEDSCKALVSRFSGVDCD